MVIPRIIKSFAKRLLGIHRKRSGCQSYSQEGEDIVLAKIFLGKPDGFYVDVGACLPVRFSSTYYFYLRGWRGINIDATPDCMKEFDRLRPEDINIEAAVANGKTALPFRIFTEPALNTFSEEAAAHYCANSRNRLVSITELPTRTLAEILEEHLPPGRTVDFMNIDVEGLDHKVLLSNNWDRYRPVVVLVEDLSVSTAEQAVNSRMTAFMRDHGYVLFGKTLNTLFYMLRERSQCQKRLVPAEV